MDAILLGALGAMLEALKGTAASGAVGGLRNRLFGAFRWRRLVKAIRANRLGSEYPDESAITTWLERTDVQTALMRPEGNSARFLATALLQTWVPDQEPTNDQEAAAIEVVAVAVRELIEVFDPVQSQLVANRYMIQFHGELVDLVTELRDDITAITDLKEWLAAQDNEPLVWDLRQYLKHLINATIDPPGYLPRHAPDFLSGWQPVQVEILRETLWRGAEPPGVVEMKLPHTRAHRAADRRSGLVSWNRVTEDWRSISAIGGPGSGKTSLARHEANRAAHTAYRSLSEMPDDVQLSDVRTLPPLPVWVEVGRLLEQPHLAAVWEPLLSASARHCAAELGPERVQLLVALLARCVRATGAECIVIIDGLDECPESDDLRAIGRTVVGGGHTLRVFSRPDGYYDITDQISENRTSSTKVELRPFAMAQIDALFDAWYPNPESEERQRLDRAIGDLGNASELLRMPLFATILCIVVAYDDTDLAPTTRGALIERFLWTLLSRRHRSTDHTRTDREVRELMDRAASVAWRLATHRTGWRESCSESERVRLRLDCDGIDDVLQRTHRYSLGTGSIEFVHRAVHEFLCAWHVASREVEQPGSGMSELRKYWWSLDDWRDVISYCAHTISDPHSLFDSLKQDDIGGYLYPIQAALALSESPENVRQDTRIKQDIGRRMEVLLSLAPEWGVALGALREAPFIQLDWLQLAEHDNFDVAFFAAKRYTENIQDLTNLREILTGFLPLSIRLQAARRIADSTDVATRVDAYDAAQEIIAEISNQPQHPWLVDLWEWRVDWISTDGSLLAAEHSRTDHWLLSPSDARILMRDSIVQMDELDELRRLVRAELDPDVVLPAAERLLQLTRDASELWPLVRHPEDWTASWAADQLVSQIDNEHRLWTLVESGQPKYLRKAAARKICVEIHATDRLWQLVQHENIRIAQAAASRLLFLLKDADPESLEPLTEHHDFGIRMWSSSTLSEVDPTRESIAWPHYWSSIRRQARRWTPEERAYVGASWLEYRQPWST